MTIKKIRMTLKEVVSYFDQVRSGARKREALSGIKKAMYHALFTRVFVTNLSDVYSIHDFTEMVNLIKSKGKPRKGSYNAEYAAWKIRKGLPPHIVTGQLISNTFIERVADSILFYIPSAATTRTKSGTTFNFGPIHEARKSILKATMVFAWENIIKAFVKAYEP